MPDDLARLIAALNRPGGGSSDFDLNPAFAPPSGRALRPAAVLVPVWLHRGAARVILTKRASHLKHHPGQIAFPGGKVDEGDADLEAPGWSGTTARDSVIPPGAWPEPASVPGLDTPEPQADATSSAPQSRTPLVARRISRSLGGPQQEMERKWWSGPASIR